MKICVCGLVRPFTSRSLKSAQVVRARNDTIYHGSQINNAMRGWLWFPRLYGAGNRPRKGINSSHANLWNFLWAKNRLIFLIWSFMFEGFFFVILGQWFPILFCILGVSKNVHLQGIHIKLPFFKYQKSPQSY